MKMSAAVVRALVLGSVVGLVAAFTPACGPVRKPVTCNASNCPGCCDENAQCFTGLADVSCGSNGASCTACSSGQTCQSAGSDGGTGGRCLSGNTGTGGGSAGGAASTGGGSATAGGTGGSSGGGAAVMCNAQNCPNGCCTANGTCQMTPTTAKCGTGGAACMACPSRQTCVMGACAACAGCVDLATGRCETGTADMLCGKSGDFCANCGVSNGTCTNQICTGSMSGCNPTNCATGCCDQGSGACIEPAAQNGQQCGQGTPAALCTQCASGQCDTDGGVCIGGSMGGGAGGGLGGGFPGLDGGGGLPGLCDSSMPCANGQCCSSLGLCVPNGPVLGGILGTFCGANGGTCSTCTFGQTCNMTSGMCQ
ncbi:MAG: hypothetical protein ABTQ32_27310 [Myxococcaceae bacterium]